MKRRALVLAVSVSSLLALTAGSAFALAAALPPTISASFSPGSIAVSGTSTLQFTITNPNTTAPGVVPNSQVQNGSLTGVAFTDTLPAGLVVATPNGLAGGNCGGGTITATAGTSTISLANGVLGPSASCTISVSVTGSWAGYFTDSVTVTSIQSGSGSNTATASISVGIAPPTITAAFGATSIAIGGMTSLTFTITNPNAFTVPTVVPAALSPVALTGIAFTDTLPAGLAVATPNGLAGGNCGGTITATAGGSTISLSGGTLDAQESCSFHLNVVGVAAGSQENSTGPVSSTESGAGNPGSAGITVAAPAATPAPTPAPTPVPTPVRTATPPPTSTAGSGGPGNDAPAVPWLVLLIAAGVAAAGLSLRSAIKVRL